MIPEKYKIDTSGYPTIPIESICDENGNVYKEGPQTRLQKLLPKEYEAVLVKYGYTSDRGQVSNIYKYHGGDEYMIKVDIENECQTIMVLCNNKSHRFILLYEVLFTTPQDLEDLLDRCEYVRAQKKT